MKIQKPGNDKLKKQISLCILFLLIFFAAPFAVVAETVATDGGTIDIETVDNVTNYNVSGNPVWNVPEFNIAESSIYNITGITDNASLAVLVGGDTASNIFGTLNLSNLDFILQNINGINIGSTGVVNVDNANFIASTLPLNLTNVDFLAHQYEFEGSSGFILNEGKIQGTDAELVALVANAIENRGTIEVPMGTVALAAGDLVTVGISADGIVSIGVDPATANELGLTDQIKNSGTITADGGKVVLDAKAVDGLFDHAINLTGEESATSVIRAADGTIEFVAEGGDVVIDGTVEAPAGVINIEADGNVDIQGVVTASQVDMPEAGTVEVVTDGVINISGTVTAGALEVGPADITLEELQGDITGLVIPDSIVIEETAQVSAGLIMTITGEVVEVGSPISAPTVVIRGTTAVETRETGLIEATSLTINTLRFGTSETPVTVDADSIYLNRLNGEIDLRESILMGDGVWVRGPPEGEIFNLFYNHDATEVVFDAEKVVLGGSEAIEFYGNLTFYNLECATPWAALYFEPGMTYTFKGSLRIEIDDDTYASVYLKSQVAGEVWYVNVDTEDYLLKKVAVQDSYNIGLDPIYASPSNNLGNNTRWVLNTVYWVADTDAVWSVGGNWSGGIAPGVADDVVFDATHVGNSTIDSDFTITSLTISGYTGTITQEGNLTISGDYDQDSGTFTCADPSTYSFSAGGSFSIDETVADFDRFTGSGTELDPYLVRDVYDLQAMKCDLSAYYQQSGDIDASGTSSWNSDGEGGYYGFDPIGDSVSPFTGTYDGQRYEISDLYIYRPVYEVSSNNTGLFGYASSATIQDVGITGGDVTGNQYTGGVVGYMINSTLSGSYFEGDVHGEYRVGGVLGGYETSTVTECHSSGTVTGIGAVGGLVGYAYYNGGISDSYSSSNVLCPYDGFSGGLVGHIKGSFVSTSYATGFVQGWGSAGGFVGYVSPYAAESIFPTISDCYSTGNVEIYGAGGTVYVGGFAGEVYSTSIYRCYSTGNVTGATADYAAGFVGTMQNGSAYDIAGIYSSYTTGSVTGDNTVKGFLGYESYFSYQPHYDEVYYTQDITDDVAVRETLGSSVFYGDTHDVYNEGTYPWDFGDAWLAQTSSFPLIFETLTEYVWDGGGATDNWSDADNWDLDSVPTALSEVIFNATSTKDSIIDEGFNDTGTIAALSIGSDYTGTITVDTPLTVSGDVVIDGGTLTGTGDVTVQGGDVTGDGTINMTGGMFTLSGAGDFGGDTDWTFYSLTYGDGIEIEITSKIGTNDITVANELIIGLEHTLEGGTSTWDLSWNEETAYLSNITQIVSGGTTFAFAICGDGYVYGWGDNSYGQLGDGTNIDRHTPVRVLGGEQGGEYLTDISQISVGRWHTIALKSDGSEVYCWGSGSYGKLGNGTVDVDYYTPVKVLSGEQGGGTYLTDISQISAGRHHNFALKSDGSEVYAWGFNTYGILGDGTEIHRSTPVKVVGGDQGGEYLTDISQVVAGWYNSIALKSDGSEVYCWGNNSDGQVGDGSTTHRFVPTRVLGGEQGGEYLTDIAFVEAGHLYSLAIKSDGSEVYAWGVNDQGQLGDNTVTRKTTPIKMLGGEQGGEYLTGISKVSAGYRLTLALSSDGSAVYACGDNLYYQLGDGTNIDKRTPNRVLGGVQGGEYLTDISSIDAGFEFSMALKSDGSAVYTWGRNNYGQLGDNTLLNRSVAVNPLRGEASNIPFIVNGTFVPETSLVEYLCDYDIGNALVAATTYYDLVINNASETFEFNDATTVNNDLQITSGAVNVNDSLVIGGDLVVSGSLSGTGSITVSGGSVTGDGTINLTDGTFTLDGTGDFGGSTDWTIYNLTFGDGVDAEVTSKTGDNKITVTNELYISLNQTLEAGSGTWDLSWYGDDAHLTNISQIVAGRYHTLALNSDGSEVYAWGQNGYGELGDGTNIDRHTPVRVLGGEQGGEYLTGISQLAVGPYYSIALKSDGSAVYAWGENTYGQLGDGTYVHRSTPVKVLGGAQGGTYLTDISQIDAALYSTVALKSDGSEVYAWGRNQFGQLGDGTTDNSNIPVKVLGGEQGGEYLTDVSQISIGGYHTLALKSDGSEVYSWGYNGWMQLGDGTNVDKYTPIKVLGGVQGGTYLTDISQISAGEIHNVALKSDGSEVYTWGANNVSQLGDGTGSIRSTPVKVLGGEQGGTYLTGISQISAGAWHTVALNSDGSEVYSWGRNDFGQLGDGTTENRNTPVKVLGGVQGGTYLTDISQISSGYYYTAALKNDGSEVYIWGSNVKGELGDGTIIQRSTAVKVLREGAISLPFTINGTFDAETSLFEYTGEYTSGNIPVAATTYYDLVINNASETFELSGAVVVENDLNITAGTLDVSASNYALNIGGSFTNAGAFTPRSGTVTFTAIDTGNTITSNGSSFYNLTFDGIGGEWTLQDALAVNNDLTITNGTVNVSDYSVIDGNLVVSGSLLGTGSITVNGGSVTGDGTINLTDGIFTVDGTGDFGGSTDWTFYNLTFGDGDDSEVTSKIGDNKITVTNELIISLNQTLEAGTGTWDLSWDGGGAELTNISQVVAGRYHTVALNFDGSAVYTWGYNGVGQLGDGTTENSSIPVRVLGGEQGGEYLTDIYQVVVGRLRTVALTNDGEVYSWGSNQYGQLGDGTTENRYTPVKVLGGEQGGTYLTDISQISAGEYYTVALKNDGSEVYSWGYNVYGQLGDGSNDEAHTPVKVLGGAQGGEYLTDISQISAGYHHVVALKSDGSEVYAWGINTYGQLGDGFPGVMRVTPIKVLGGEQGGEYLTGISQVFAGAHHTLALKSDGTEVYSWGLNDNGQLGDGTTDNRSTPVKVLGGEQGGTYLTGISEIVAGYYHTVAIASDGGTVYAWGDNEFGQLGDGTTDDSYTPVKVLGGEQGGTYLTGISQVSAGGYRTVALKNDGSEIYSWGPNGQGQVGDGTLIQRNTAVKVLRGEIESFPFTVNGTFDAETSLFEYTGEYVSGNIPVAATTYYDLVINNASETFELSGAVVVENDLNITAGTLDVSASNYALNIGGSFTNAGAFTPRSGTVTFTAIDTGNTITSNGSSFYNLTFDGIGGEWTLQDALAVNNDLTITNGTLIAGANAIDIAGNFSNAGSITSSGTVTFSATDTDNTITSGGSSFYNLVFNGVGGEWTLQDALVVDNDLTIQDGTLIAGANNIDVDGDFSQIAGIFVGGTGTIDVEGSLVIASGTFTAPQTNLSIGMDFTVSNVATFIHNNGTVTLDTTNAATVDVTGVEGGILDLWNFTILGDGKVVSFGAGDVFNVFGMFTVSGVSGNETVVQSTDRGGSMWNLGLEQNSWDFSYMKIYDLNNSNFSSVGYINEGIMTVGLANGGNNRYVFYPVPVPTTDPGLSIVTDSTLSGLVPDFSLTSVVVESLILTIDDTTTADMQIQADLWGSFLEESLSCVALVIPTETINSFVAVDTPSVETATLLKLHGNGGEVIRHLQRIKYADQVVERDNE